MTSVSPEVLKARALRGDGDAQFALARLFDREGRHDVAVSWLDKAARGGHAPSMVYLGSRLVVGRAAPFAPAEGAALLERAAAAGSGEAANRMAVLAATGVGRRQSWDQALDLLQRAAELGHQPACRQLELIGHDPTPNAVEGGRWGRLRRSFDLAAWARTPAPTVLSAAPPVASVAGFLSPAICAWLIDRSRGALSPARVNDFMGGARRQDDTRTNTVRGFGLLDTDLLLVLVRARIAAAAGLPVAWQEACNVLHYDPGQQFGVHVDFIDPAAPHFAQELREQGQRLGTFLVYLNDGFEGGETDFPALGVRYRGGVGDALFFRNADDTGRPDDRTAHAGLPPATGEKWLLSQWIRDRPQPFA